MGFEARGDGTALVLVDVINDLDFDGGRAFLQRALPAAERIRTLLDRAYAAGAPVVYANDNFGHWRDDFREVLRHCLEDDVPGTPLARALRPRDDDYIVLKPRHSAFLDTPLDYLLKKLEVDELVLAGFATDLCVQITAGDAHMRGYRLRVPHDASAAETDERHRRALEWMERAARADTAAAEEVTLEDREGMP